MKHKDRLKLKINKHNKSQKVKKLMITVTITKWHNWSLAAWLVKHLHYREFTCHLLYISLYLGIDITFIFVWSYSRASHLLKVHFRELFEWDSLQAGWPSVRKSIVSKHQRVNNERVFILTH